MLLTESSLITCRRGAFLIFYSANAGDLNFVNSSQLLQDNKPGISTGAVSVDLDRDGDLDIVTNNINAPASLLINQTNDQNYIRLDLRGDKMNTRGIGTKINVFAGHSQFFYENNPVKGIMSASSDDLSIGIGSPTAIDSVVVEWIGGYKETVTGIRGGQSIIIEQGNAGLIAGNNPKIPEKIFEPAAINIPFSHHENDFIDANSEKLMPWLLSTHGPALAVADVNGDGMDDVFLGGAKEQPSALFIQNAGSQFIPANEELWEKEKYYEDVAALFFDTDNDGDQDLYVVSGGNEHVKDSPLFLDRLYLNDGQGNFTRILGALPLNTENGSSVSAADFDQDGDMDLVIGSIALVGNYGYSKGANLLVNDGQGKFIDRTNSIAPGLRELGMITDLKWADIDEDGDEDIIVVGEWMSVTIMINETERFFKKELENSTGLWQSLKIVDLDDDGLQDLIAGNFGTNTFLAQEKRAGMTWGDFDGNLSFEPLIYYVNGGVKSPVAGRDLLISQMNFFKSLHDNYYSFAVTSFDEMFGPVLNKKIKDIVIDEFETCWFKNIGNGQFRKMSLPKVAQFAPTFTIDVEDYNRDGHKDILLGGNFYEISPYIGKADASLGVYLESDGSGNYINIEPDKSGFMVRGQIREMTPIIVNGRRFLLVARNNDSVQIWSVH